MVDQLLSGGDDLDWRKPILGSVGGGRQGAGTPWQWQLVHKVCIRTSANLKQCNPWLTPHLRMVDPLLDGWPTGWLTHSWMVNPLSDQSLRRQGSRQAGLWTLSKQQLWQLVCPQTPKICSFVWKQPKQQMWFLSARGINSEGFPCSRSSFCSW